MSSIFNDRFFEDFFELGFGKPTKIVFNANGLKDLMPACWQKTEDGYKARIKTLGLTEVKVDVLDDGIKVYGENEIDSLKYDTSMTLPISQDVMDNIIEIKHETIAGVTLVSLIVDRPAKRQIKINGK